MTVPVIKKNDDVVGGKYLPQREKDAVKLQEMAG
jgi:hypothetical protein